MELDDLVLVSVDDHIVEPPDMFVGRLPKKFEERGPRVVGNSEGRFQWSFGDQTSKSLTTAATVGRPQDEKNVEPTSFDEVRPGTYNVHERVKDMSANGVVASLNFPSFPRFCAQMFTEVAKADPDLALSVVKAYNDWHIDEWCAAYPGRFIPCAIMPMWDPQLMAKEVRRVAEKGCHALTFSMNPYGLGLPSFHTDYWDPFWAACDELETVVCMHFGSGPTRLQTSPDAPFLVQVVAEAIMLLPTSADLIFSPVLRKFKNLTIALSEGGIGWIPYFLERADFVYHHHLAWLPDHEYHGVLPSELFKERIVTCFIEDEVGIENLHHLNPKMVTWESDYPHPDSTWPTSAERAWRDLQKQPDDIIEDITHRNAMRIFHFDPFGYLPREACTVGGLRRSTAGHDVSEIPGRLRKHALRTQGGYLGITGTEPSH